MASLLPDPTTLSEQLEHALATREHLDRVIAWLKDGMALMTGGERDSPSVAREMLAVAPAPDAVAVETNGVTDAERAATVRALESLGPTSITEPEQLEPEPAAEQPAPPPLRAVAPARSSGRFAQRDYKAKVVAALLHLGGPQSKAAIAEFTGFTPEQISKPLQELVADGNVIAEGAGRGRRYRARDVAPHSEAGARTQAGRAHSERKLTSAVARVGLRDRVRKMIAAEPECHDNATLAAALGAHVDDIGDACQSLVDSRVIVMSDSGYRRTVGALVREAGDAEQ